MKVEKHIRALNQYKDALGDEHFVTFTTKLWELAEVSASPISWDAGTRASQERRVAQHKPLFSYETPQISLDWAHQVFSKIRELLIAEEMVDAATAAELQALDITAIKCSDLENAVLDTNRVISRVCTRLNVKPDALLANSLALMVVAMVRIFASAAAQLIEVDLQSVELPAHQLCPVCGQPPALATVRPSIGHDGGHRFLYCSSCETVWHFPRIRCAHCGETNPHKLKYFHEDGDQMHQLHLCATCGHVTPTVLQAHRPAQFLYSPRVEELYGTRLAHAFVSSEAAQNYFEAAQS